MHADEYPFVELIREDNDSSKIVRVGVYSPIDFRNQQGTIIGNQREISRSKSFVQAVKSLYRAAGVDFSNADYVTLMVDVTETYIDIHPDYADNRTRSFLQLSGFKTVIFEPVPILHVPTYHVSAVLSVGDFYAMDFKADDSTIPHGVVYYGEPYSIGMYINHETPAI